MDVKRFIILGPADSKSVVKFVTMTHLHSNNGCKKFIKSLVDANNGRR
jgi:hypothetical protein